MGRNTFSLEDVEKLIESSTFAQNFIQKELVKTYEEFVSILYDDLDRAINEMEHNPQFYYSNDEDTITHHLVTMLKMKNYDARQGETAGGNVDVTVFGKNADWNWIGEAKIYKTLDNLNEGFLQLTTRYKNASHMYMARGILAYTKRKGAANHLRTWRNSVKEMRLSGFSESDCERRPKLAFFTEHEDEASGLPVTIRHSVICLYQLPKDKSGLSAKKFKDRVDE